jgi:hypothetical protein
MSRSGYPRSARWTVGYFRVAKGTDLGPAFVLRHLQNAGG